MAELYQLRSSVAQLHSIKELQGWPAAGGNQWGPRIDSVNGAPYLYSEPLASTFWKGIWPVFDGVLSSEGRVQAGERASLDLKQGEGEVQQIAGSASFQNACPPAPFSALSEPKGGALQGPLDQCCTHVPEMVQLLQRQQEQLNHLTELLLLLIPRMSSNSVEIDLAKPKPCNGDETGRNPEARATRSPSHRTCGTRPYHTRAASPEAGAVHSSEMADLQRKDPVIGMILPFVKEHRRPGRAERRCLHPSAHGLLRQLKRLTIREGLLYRTYRRPGGSRGKVIQQLVLPGCLWRQAFQKFHVHHDIEAIETTMEAIQGKYYWTGMRRTVTNWCNKCECCKLASKSENHHSAMSVPGSNRARDAETWDSPHVRTSHPKNDMVRPWTMPSTCSRPAKTFSMTAEEHFQTLPRQSASGGTHCLDLDLVRRSENLDSVHFQTRAPSSTTNVMFRPWA